MVFRNLQGLFLKQFCEKPESVKNANKKESVRPNHINEGERKCIDVTNTNRIFDVM